MRTNECAGTCEVRKNNPSQTAPMRRGRSSGKTSDLQAEVKGMRRRGYYEEAHVGRKEERRNTFVGGRDIVE